MRVGAAALLPDAVPALGKCLASKACGVTFLGGGAGSGTGHACCDASRCLITLASQRRVSGWMGWTGLTRRSSPACIAHTTQIPCLRPRQNRRRMRRGLVCCTRRRSSAGASGALATMRLSVPATDPRDIHACLGRYDLCRTAGRSDIGSVRDRAHGKKGANSEHRWEPSPSRTVGANFGC